EKMLHYHEPTPEMHAKLERRLSEPSLRDVFFDALAVLGVMPELRPDATDEERFQARAEAILAVYRDERGHRDWIDGWERLTQFAEPNSGAQPPQSPVHFLTRAVSTKAAALALMPPHTALRSWPITGSNAGTSAIRAS